MIIRRVVPALVLLCLLVTEVAAESKSGQEAVQSLGEQIEDCASEHNLEVADLQYALTADSSLKLDGDYRLFYACPAPSQPPLSTQSAVASFPLSETFKLHSKAGSNKVIYLDFDGHQIVNSAWNVFGNVAQIDAPAWDIDGDPSTFSNQERQIIQGIWARVSEDFAPFDVDVTTEFPGDDAIYRSSASDNDYGTRVLISPISQYFGRYGGFAYIGVFDYLGSRPDSYYKPALVFSEVLFNNEKYIAEAASHEAGHNLGLRHDGTTQGQSYYSGHGSGTTSWAPIMGSAYTSTLSQFSKGEYLHANNKENDFITIQSNGLSYRIDDHSDTEASATQLLGSPIATASGTIEDRTDIDVFKIESGAGSLVIDVQPVVDGPNIDLSIALRNAAGLTLAISNPVNSIDSRLRMNVTEGTYYVFVEGVGKGSPTTGYSDYGSIGQYSIVASIPAAPVNVAPVAVASATPIEGRAPHPVQFSSAGSHDPDGQIVSYHWDFGDGSEVVGLGGISIFPNPSYTYQQAGTFVATLTVTDNFGASSTQSVKIYATKDGAPVIRNLRLIPPFPWGHNDWTDDGRKVFVLKAVDNIEVSRVEVLIDGQIAGDEIKLVQERGSRWKTYRLRWSNPPSGKYTLTFNVYDNLGQVASKELIVVNP